MRAICASCSVRTSKSSTFSPVESRCFSSSALIVLARGGSFGLSILKAAPFGVSTKSISYALRALGARAVEQEHQAAGVNQYVFRLLWSDAEGVIESRIDVEANVLALFLDGVFEGVRGSFADRHVGGRDVSKLHAELLLQLAALEHVADDVAAADELSH